MIYQESFPEAIYKHPWRSIFDIWIFVFLYIEELIICLIIYWIIVGVKRIFGLFKDIYENKFNRIDD